MRLFDVNDALVIRAKPEPDNRNHSPEHILGVANEVYFFNPAATLVKIEHRFPLPSYPLEASRYRLLNKDRIN